MAKCIPNFLLQVSLAGLKSFQDILNVGNGSEDESRKVSDNAKMNESTHLWVTAWKVWYNIGMDSTKPPDLATAPALKESKGVNDHVIYLPSQPFLTALVQTFISLFHHISARLVFIYRYMLTCHSGKCLC